MNKRRRFKAKRRRKNIAHVARISRATYMFWSNQHILVPLPNALFKERMRAIYNQCTTPRP